ncbi:MAG: hypothetical protein AAF676_17315 [Pseudomonadota bacterium]
MVIHPAAALIAAQLGSRHDRMTRIAWGAAALALLLSTVGAAALPMTRASVSSGAGPDDGAGETFCFEFSDVGATVACAGSAGLLGGVVTYEAEASADVDALRVRASISADADAVPGDGAPVFDTPLDGGAASASARIDDDWTFTGLAPGVAARLEVDVAVEGTASVTGPGTGGGFGSTGFILSLRNNSSGALDASASTDVVNALSVFGAVDETYTLGVDVAYGEETAIRLSLTTQPSLFFLDQGYDVIEVDMDFSNTLVPTAIRLVDDAGAPLPFALQTASGEAFWQTITQSAPSASAAVPAPAAGPLLVLGVAALASALRRRA